MTRQNIFLLQKLTSKTCESEKKENKLRTRNKLTVSDMEMMIFSGLIVFFM